MRYKQRLLRRSAMMLLALLLLLLLLLARIFAIQVFHFEHYQNKVLEQLTTESPVRAARGEILDAAGRVLATNQTLYRVTLYPHVIAGSKNADKFREVLVRKLPGVLPVSEERVREHLSHTGAMERTVATKVDRETAKDVIGLIKLERLQDVLAVEAISARYYPGATLASHVLGFTGNDGQGLYGLELQYNKVLSGQNGSYITARDSFGNELPNAYEAYIPAVDGATLHTTIDAFVQAALEEQLESAMIESGAVNRACAIAMDVNTGAILGMATSPSFDLNAPFELNAASVEKLEALGLSEGDEGYQSAKNQLLLEMWSNKSATEVYIPGSTFKTLTCSMVLEEGAVMDLDERFYCSGALQVADRTIHCHKKGGHGSITFREGLQQSCNPVMMTIAARLGCDTFYAYMQAFGLLERTGIDLPGEGNSIFHAASSFTELDLATASFGQNFKISVLQLISAVAAVANGGRLLTPYLVERIVDANGAECFQHEVSVRREVISEQTADTICKILEGGVSGTGGAKNAYVAGFRVAAKTGTSEKIGDNREARISSCIGFAPADDPRVAVVIVVDEPTEGSKYGSVVAAPYVAGTMEAILPYLGVEAVFSPEESALRTLRVPDCTGLSVARATALLEQGGFTVVVEGEGNSVRVQSPAAGTRVLAEGACLSLTLGTCDQSLITVPDLLGKTAEEANRILLDMGFNVAVCGASDYRKNQKSVVGQFPSPGSVLARGEVVTLRFAFDEMQE